MKLGLGLLTLLNVALAGFGLMMAMMSPMLFDSGAQQDQLLWAVFWTILAFPAVALVCVFVPWLFLWLKMVAYGFIRRRHPSCVAYHPLRSRLHPVLTPQTKSACAIHGS